MRGLYANVRARMEDTGMDRERTGQLRRLRGCLDVQVCVVGEDC